MIIVGIRGFPIGGLIECAGRVFHDYLVRGGALAAVGRGKDALAITCMVLDFEAFVVRIIPRMKYPNIDPVLYIWGPFGIKWYWLMYIIGFVMAFIIFKLGAKKRQTGMPMIESWSFRGITSSLRDLFLYPIPWLIIGARLGHCLIYNFEHFVSMPILMLLFFGGMSFHGGLIGLVIAGLIYSRRRGVKFVILADLGALSAPPGLFLGRIGNFINGEIYGRVTDVPWGMVFPNGGPLPRHPSQLYEAFLEGPVLFLILYFVCCKSKINGMIVSACLFFYGLFRFFIEFFRQPDFQMGFVLGPFSMGQVLCFMMMGFGILLYFYARSKNDITRVEPENQNIKKMD